MELENILSLPVIDHDVNKFIGFIDVLDIAGMLKIIPKQFFSFKN
jgi:hypothetical protein